MEKKTMGGFIAALRKANGMTQKDLAEKLNVSDKTVSRWERDDGAPDLSVIPAIAEVFDVTCDELLRGERKSPTDRAEMTDCTDTSPKGEKQRQRLLKSTLTKYKNLTYIVKGIIVTGLLVALICNFAFNRAILGFLFGAIFYVAGIVCQIVFVNVFSSKVEDAELDEESLYDYKKKVILTAEKSIRLSAFFIGFTLPLPRRVPFPLSLTFPWSTKAGGFFLYGIIFAVVFKVIGDLILCYVNKKLVKKGELRFTAKDLENYKHNRKLKLKCFISFVVIFGITAASRVYGSAHIWGTEIQCSSHYVTYDDYQEIAEFLEQEESTRTEQEFTYYDGNDIELAYYEVQSLKWPEGYQQYNPYEIEMPITVIKNEHLDNAAEKVRTINTLYLTLYPVELLVVLVIYFKKRAVVI